VDFSQEGPIVSHNNVVIIKYNKEESYDDLEKHVAFTAFHCRGDLRR
jgi:hypothetical protein